MSATLAVLPKTCLKGAGVSDTATPLLTDF